MPKVFVRIDPANVPVTMQKIEKTWHAVVPDMQYGFTFVDASIDAQYRQEYRLGEIVQIASGLAILIACLGLFGLAGLAVVRRTKEIGVRKVLGASGSRVFWLLSRDFGWIVLASALVATPVAFIVMDRWLRDFAYRITLTPDLFLLAGLIVMTVALLSVAYQGIRAVKMDPVDSLRYE
jgi:putative ABC transport system permease protein